MALKAIELHRMGLASPEREVSPSGGEEAGPPVDRLRCRG